MFHGGAKFHGECPMFDAGAKYSTERVKGSTEVLNIPRRGSNGPRRCQTFHTLRGIFSTSVEHLTFSVGYLAPPWNI